MPPEEKQREGEGKFLIPLFLLYLYFTGSPRLTGRINTKKEKKKVEEDNMLLVCIAFFAFDGNRIALPPAGGPPEHGGGEEPRAGRLHACGCCHRRRRFCRRSLLGVSFVRRTKTSSHGPPTALRLILRSPNECDALLVVRSARCSRRL